MIPADGPHRATDGPPLTPETDMIESGWADRAGLFCLAAAGVLFGLLALSHRWHRRGC